MMLMSLSDQFDKTVVDKTVGLIETVEVAVHAKGSILGRRRSARLVNNFGQLD
jgi:hypothetical protein